MRRPHLLLMLATGAVIVGISGWVIYRSPAHSLTSVGVSNPISNASSTIEVADQAPITVPIFIYHSVRPHVRGASKEVELYDTTPELLEEQLQYLKKNGYTTISPDDLIRYVTTNAKRPEKPVMLTFDDGRVEHYQTVFPLLKKYNMVGVFYVFTHAMDKNPKYMTWAQLKEMDQAGMTIASHTVSHPYMHKINPEQLTQEMSEAKKDLEAHLGKPIVHFASPFGYMDEAVMAEARKLGYITARGIRSTSPLSRDDLLNLPGIIVSDHFKLFVRDVEPNK